MIHFYLFGFGIEAQLSCRSCDVDLETFGGAPFRKQTNPASTVSGELQREREREREFLACINRLVCILIARSQFVNPNFARWLVVWLCSGKCHRWNGFRMGPKKGFWLHHSVQLLRTCEVAGSLKWGWWVFFMRRKATCIVRTSVIARKYNEGPVGHVRICVNIWNSQIGTCAHVFWGRAWNNVAITFVYELAQG